MKPAPLKRSPDWPKDLDRRVKEQRKREWKLSPEVREQMLEALARDTPARSAVQNGELEERIRFIEGEVERYRVIEALRHAARSASEERPAAREDFGEYPTCEPIAD